MADVVVNIRGNTSGLQNDLNQIGSQTPSSISGMGSQTPPPVPQISGGDTPAMPSYDRISQDIRREISSRGVMMVPGSSNFNQIINTVSQQQKEGAYKALDNKYDVLFDKLHQERRAEETKVQQDIDSQRQAALLNVNDPLRIHNINQSFDDLLQSKLKSIDKSYSPLYEQLDSDFAKEREQVDKDLTNAINDLIDELKQGNPNSYLGQLKNQYRDAINRRDNAETEEEARKASREAAEIEQRMTKAMGRQNPLQRFSAGWGTFTSIAGIGLNAYEDYIANTGRQIGVVNSAANGDAFGAMEQNLMRRKQNYAAWGSGIGGVVGGIAGGLIAGLSSLGIGVGAGIAGGAAAGAGAGSWIGSSIFELMHGDEVNQVKLGSLWAQQEKRLQEFNDLAMMTKGTQMWSGMFKYDLNSIRYSLMKKLGDEENNYFKGDGGISIYDLGYTSSAASSMLSRRLSQRGFISGNEMRRGINSEALEKVFNMSNGSLGQLSSYDRYGNDANQDFTNLVESLNKMNTLGMSNGQTLRANEFMSYQQQLLESQKSWMLNPNSNFAARQLLAAQDVYGNSLDSRGIQAISRMNEAITHPSEGISKVLTYDVIGELFPETKGNLLAIKQKQFSDNPEDRAKIQKAMFEKLTSIYGGADTTSGYLALSQYTGIENPNELKSWVNRMQKGLPEVTQGDIGKKISGMKYYTPQTSQEMLKYTDDTMKMISKELSGLRGVANTMLVTFKEQLREIVKELK